MYVLLAFLAIVLVVLGIIRLVKGEILWGVLLILLGLIVGPGGYSIFR